MVNRDAERESALKSHEMNIDNVTDKILLLENRFNEELTKSPRSDSKNNLKSGGLIGKMEGQPGPNMEEVDERLEVMRQEISQMVKDMEN